MSRKLRQNGGVSAKAVRSGVRRPANDVMGIFEYQ
jgi:hypothetical protein